MKRPLDMPSRIAAAFLSAALSAAVAAPALAGNEIVKCVDAGGHVTLTDQPCEGGAATLRLAGDAAQAPSQPQRHVIASTELRHETWKRPQAVRPVSLSRDIATLKEARRMLMLQETRPRLAGLD